MFGDFLIDSENELIFRIFNAYRTSVWDIAKKPQKTKTKPNQNKKHPKDKQANNKRNETKTHPYQYLNLA